jgi:peptide/nickel transport system ATP-binding protein
MGEQPQRVLLSMPAPFLKVEGMKVSFSSGRGETVHAVRGVSLEIERGQTLGLVGESGCGKTTLSRALLGLVPFEGRVLLEGEPLDWRRNPARLRRRLQLIFQDPYASLNPRFTIEQTLHEPLWVHFRMPRKQRSEKVARILDLAGLGLGALGKYPHEFSGGQRQRIAIARALILEPEFVIADEPVSALDVSIQAQILNMLRDMKNGLGLTVLFISHDLSVVRHVADRVAVMQRGEIVEEGDTREVLYHPGHPYTRKLLSAMPVLKK